jgi:hypothetical protein
VKVKVREQVGNLSNTSTNREGAHEKFTNWRSLTGRKVPGIGIGPRERKRELWDDKEGAEGKKFGPKRRNYRSRVQDE